MKTKLRVVVWVIGMLCLSVDTMSEPKEMRATSRHEVRIGVGESVVDGALIASHDVYVMKNTYVAPNLFAEYQYRVNDWCGVGVQVNGAWRGSYLCRRGDKTMSWMHITIGTLAIMPTVRFTYLHREWVNLYSALSFGYYIGFGNCNRDRSVGCGAAGSVCLLGISVGRNHFFASGEIGALCGVADNGVEQLGSRLLSISLGYRF